MSTVDYDNGDAKSIKNTINKKTDELQEVSSINEYTSRLNEIKALYLNLRTLIQDPEIEIMIQQIDMQLTLIEQNKDRLIMAAKENVNK